MMRAASSASSSGGSTQAPQQPTIVVDESGNLGLNFGPLVGEVNVLSPFASEHSTPSTDGSPLSSPLNDGDDDKLALDLGLAVDTPLIDDFTQLYTDVEADIVDLSAMPSPPAQITHDSFNTGLSATLAPAQIIPRAPPATPTRAQPLYSRPAFTPRSNPYATLGLLPTTPTTPYLGAIPKNEPHTPSPPRPAQSPLLTPLRAHHFGIGAVPIPMLYQVPDPVASLAPALALSPLTLDPALSPAQVLAPTPAPTPSTTPRCMPKAPATATTTKGNARDGAVIPPRGDVPDVKPPMVSPSQTPTTVVTTPETPPPARGESSDSATAIDPELLDASSLSPPIALTSENSPAGNDAARAPTTPQWRWINYTEADADFLMTGVAPSGGRGGSRRRYDDGGFSDEEDEYDPAAHSPTLPGAAAQRTPRTPGRTPRKPSTAPKTPRTPSCKNKTTPGKAPKTPKTPRRVSRN